LLEEVPIIVHTEHRSADTLGAIERAALAILNRRTDVIVTFSERTAQLVRRRESVRDLHVIPNGIPVQPIPTENDRRFARRKLDIDQNNIAIGIVANLHPHKNPGLAIDAIARLPSRTRDVVRLAVFGDGPLRDDLSARAKKLGIETLVRFYGFRVDMAELLPGLDLILTTSAREMMPMSLLESMNAALPIIGAPHAGTLDLVVDGETGIVLRSWDAGQLAEAIEWAVSHAEWRSQAGRDAYNRLKQNFDIEKVADQYVELYHRLLSRRRVAS
jgi:glycosyltransferase involved in cell wall biosynthesis